MKSFWMRLWNCGPIQYPLLMKNSIFWYKTRAVSVGYPDRDCSVFGSRCLEWSLDSSCPGHHSVLRQTGSCPEFPVWVVLHDLPTQRMRSSGFLVPPKQPYCYTFILRTLLGAQKNLGAGFFCLTYLSLFSIPSFPLTLPSFPIKKEKPKPN